MSLMVPQLSEALQRCGLLSPTELNAVRSGWFVEKRQDSSDPHKFGRWLVLNGYLSEFSLRLLQNGQADRLRLNQYLLVEPLTRGPLAGGYLALDPLRRKVVVEVLSASHAANPDTVHAFQIAVQQAMTVHHPNVNHTIDLGQANGVHYLVREYDEGETLADILARRGKLGTIPAARLFALALAGLSALHDKGVSAGELTGDCLLLTSANKSARPGPAGKQRTIKVLHAGVPRYLFDSSTLLKPSAPSVIEPAPTPSFPAPRVQDDLLRLGMLFYQSLTGQTPAGPPLPVCQLAPDVPEMLGELVDQMLAVEPQKRPRSAAHAAKALRVFLASEEEVRETRGEEHLAAPVADRPPAVEEIPQEDEDAGASAGAEKEQKAQAEEGVKGKLVELWQDVRPRERDLVFLGSGAAGVILLVLLLMLLTGIRFVNLVCLLTGGGSVVLRGAPAALARGAGQHGRVRVCALSRLRLSREGEAPAEPNQSGSAGASPSRLSRKRLVG